MMLHALLGLFFVQAQAAPPVIVKPPSDAAVTPNIRSLGDMFQLAGHCSRYVPAEDMRKFFYLAESDPKNQPYLIMRMGRGSQAPRDVDWCAESMAALRK